MKALCATIIVVLLLLPAQALSQIANAGFETWALGTPTGWAANNIPTVAVPITQSTTAHSGSSALSGTVVSFLTLGAYSPSLTGIFPISQRYATFSVWYRFAPVGGDSILGTATFVKSKAGIGIATFTVGGTVGTYTQINKNILYFGAGIPDTVIISTLIVGPRSANDSVHLGSTMLLDDFSLSGTNGVERETSVPTSFALHQNYPNPFNPATVIKYDLPVASHVSLRVFNALGQEVATLVNADENPGVHDVRFEASGLPSGAYFYRLSAGTYTETRRLLVLK